MCKALPAGVLCALLLVATQLRAAPLPFIEEINGDLGNFVPTHLTGQGTVGGQLAFADIDLLSFDVAPGSQGEIDAVFVNTSAGGIPGGGYDGEPMFTFTITLTSLSNAGFDLRSWEFMSVGPAGNLLDLMPTQGAFLPYLPGGDTYQLRLDREPLAEIIEYQFDLVAVPEPAAGVLLLAGLAIVLARRRSGRG